MQVQVFYVAVKIFKVRINSFKNCLRLCRKNYKNSFKNKRPLVLDGFNS